MANEIKFVKSIVFVIVIGKGNSKAKEDVGFQVRQGRWGPVNRRGKERHEERRSLSPTPIGTPTRLGGGASSVVKSNRYAASHLRIYVPAYYQSVQ